jgi:hypothetical protein
MDPITSVMRIMTDSVSSVKLATLTMSAFRQARLKSEEEGMDSATGRAADAMPNVVQSGQASQAALVRAQAEVQAQENLHRQLLQEEAEAAARAQDRARVRQALKEAREGILGADTKAEDDGGQDSGEAGPYDQSNERRADRKTAKPGSEPPRDGNPPEKGVVYTHLGEVKPKSADKKLTVTA